MIFINIKQDDKEKNYTFDEDAYNLEKAVATAKRYFRLDEKEGFSIAVISK